jgi:hypothetical protein
MKSVAPSLTPPRLSLREIQTRFCQAVMNPLTADQRMAETLTNGGSISALAQSIIKPNPHLNSFERLELYSRQYWFRLIDCLYDDFPGLRAIMGENKFYDLVTDYLAAYPSRSFTLRNLGSSLPQFVQKNKKYSRTRYRAAIDMVRFEWAQVIAFDGPALSALTPEALLATEPEKLQLQLQPYLSLLELRYPFDELLISLRLTTTQRSEASTARLRKVKKQRAIRLPRPQRIYLVVHRFENSLYYKRIDRAAFALLTDLQSGKPLAEACQRAAGLLPKREQTPDKITTIIRTWFTTWSQLHWFGIAD